MIDLDILYVEDAIYILIAPFILTLILSVFLSLPNDGWDKIMYVFQIYIILLLLFGIFYTKYKESNKNFTYMTQDSINLIFVILIFFIFGFFFIGDIVSKRKTQYGVISFLIMIVALIVIFLLIIANSTLSQQMGLNYNTNNLQMASTRRI